jgi:hypothetical protein
MILDPQSNPLGNVVMSETFKSIVHHCVDILAIAILSILLRMGYQRLRRIRR